MEQIVSPHVIDWDVMPPASKSLTIRAMLCGMLAGTAEIHNPAICDDTIACLELINSLGAEIYAHNNKLIIERKEFKFPESINCGESALCMRMMPFVLGSLGYSGEITGEGTLINRNMNGLIETLRSVGLNVESNGFAPLKISGNLKAGRYLLPAQDSSQAISGLIMALCNLNDRSHVLVSGNTPSHGYIKMSLNLYKKFGAVIVNMEDNSYKIEPAKFSPTFVGIESDWSAIAFLLVAGAIGGKVTVKNVFCNSLQPDKAILKVLEMAGANLLVQGSTLTIEQSELKAFDFDATNCPDLIPPLVALAINCKGTSRIKGVHRLKNKESDRATALVEEFSMINAQIRILGDELLVQESNLDGGVVSSRNDHRIAMALAIAAIKSSDKVIIKNAESVAKSYPQFWELFWSK